jgi:hypothetical protein
VISAKKRCVHSALRASSTCPSRSVHSINAATTGTGLSQCTKPQAGLLHAIRICPFSGVSASGEAQRGQ